ncbi:MAG TPA: DUF2281 domain-containing protein [Anaerolineae bacterium]|nr:DUF2281 domain-containing protein [Anaerolineae bacterium]HIP73886.1 DUF2281 domain-containing protein [Anaerolineae bacterium]
MLIEETVLKKLRKLPPEKQQEALDFVEFLEYKQELSLETVVARIRERAGEYNIEEMDALIEEARNDFYRQQNASRAD